MDCANGASEYLLYGGIITITANVVGLIAGCARQAALKVGMNVGFIQTLSFRMDGFPTQKTVDFVSSVYLVEYLVLLH